MELSLRHQLGLFSVILLFPALCNCKEYYTNSRATFYGTPDGYGTPSGACGFGKYGSTMNDGNVAAVSGLWRNGAGCGACYQVRCKIPEYCDEKGVNVVATDYGEGDRTDFIMSPRAFKKLGRDEGASEQLKKSGTVDVEFERVPCRYPANILLHIQESSSIPTYFAVSVLNVNGKYDITEVDMWQNGRWEPLHRVQGAVFDYSNPPSGAIPLRLQASNYGWVYPISIPSNWKPGATYDTQVQIY